MPDSDRPAFAIRKTRTRFLGLTMDECIQAFFGGNALVAVLVLGLITVFLFREGSGFFKQNQSNIEVYRTAGLEYVDHLKRQEADHTALTRYLFDLRVRVFKHHTEVEGATLGEANQQLIAFDDYSYDFGDTVEPLREAIYDLSESVTATKTRMLVNEDRLVERQQLRDAGAVEAAEAVVIEEIDLVAARQPLLAFRPVYGQINGQFAASLLSVLAAEAPAMPTAELEARFTRFHELVEQYIDGFPTVEAALNTCLLYTSPSPRDS